MPDPYAWDCTNPRCARRNIWRNEHCRECHWPRHSGAPVFAPPLPAPIVPAPRIPIDPPYPPPLPPLPTTGGPWAFALLALFVMFSAPGLFLVALAFGLLWAIAAGVWRMAGSVMRSGPGHQWPNSPP